MRSKEISRKEGIYYLIWYGLEKIMSCVKIDLYDKCHFLFWFLYSRLLNKPLIHVIGDSHTGSFKRSKLFVVHYIGPATAYNLKKNKSTTNSKKKLFTIIDKIKRKRDFVMLVFGEIDCRIHIYNQYKKNNGRLTIIELIDKTISNYGYVLEQLNHMGITFFIYGISPASKQGNVYGYPFYAPAEIRSEIYREFNERLKKFCKKNGYRYMDIYLKVSDKNGFTLEEYANGDVHLNSKVKKFVRKWVATNVVNI